MKKGDISEGIIERVDFPNKGILTVDGDRIVVKNVLPGQKIRGIIGKKRKGKAEGRLLELLERSPMESETEFCHHFGSCGGCSYQSMPYEKQLELRPPWFGSFSEKTVPMRSLRGLRAAPDSTAIVIRWNIRLVTW